MCVDHFFTFKTSFYPYAFYNKWLQTLFKDQLVRSKATCSFNTVRRKVGTIYFEAKSELAATATAAAVAKDVLCLNT